MCNKLWNRYHTGKILYVHKYGIREIICMVILEVLWERETVKGHMRTRGTGSPIHRRCSFFSRDVIFFFKMIAWTDSHKKPIVWNHRNPGIPWRIIDMLSIITSRQLCDGQTKRRRMTMERGAVVPIRSWVGYVHILLQFVLKLIFATRVFT